jgi:hypothetical protein
MAGSAVVPVVLAPANGLHFGAQKVNTTSAPQPVTLTNNKSVTLNVSSVVTSAGFQQTNNCLAGVPAGGTCTINVRFAPTTSGSISGTLTIGDDAYGSPQTLSLAGQGT